MSPPAMPDSPARPDSDSSVRATIVGREPGVLHEPARRGRVDGPRARRHHEPFERREAHRRVDRTAADASRTATRPRPDGSSRRASSDRRIAPDELARRDATRRRAKAVEAEAAHPPLLAPASRERVGGGRGRERRVERGVEARDLRKRGEHARACRRMPATARGWCSGASGVEREQRAFGAGVDHGPARGTRCRRARPGGRPRRTPAARRATLVELRPSRPRRRLPAFDVVLGLDLVVVAEHAQLEAARSRVHDEHAHQFRPARPSRGPRACPRRARACTRTCRVRCVDHVLAHVRGGAHRARARGRSRPSRGGSGPCRCSTTMSNGVVTVPSSL